VDQAGYGRTTLQHSNGAGRGSTRSRFAAPRKPRGAAIAGCLVDHETWAIPYQGNDARVSGVEFEMRC
jgi:hypothetical protein